MDSGCIVLALLTRARSDHLATSLEEKQNNIFLSRWKLKKTVCSLPYIVPEFSNNLWGLGTEQEYGLSYQPVRLHRLAELIPWNRFLVSLNVLKNWALSSRCNISTSLSFILSYDAIKCCQTEAL
jgi:hypothetical protein